MLSDKDRKDMADIVAREDAWMAERGVTWSVTRDYEELRRFGYEISGFLNTTFEPRVRQPVPADFWCRFTDQDDRTIGSVAIAIFQDCDLREAIKLGHLWYDDTPEWWLNRPDLDLDPVVAKGTVVHAGAIMVDRAWRKTAIDDAAGRFSTHMIRLSRALTLTRYDIDWWTGIFRSDMFENRATLFAYSINPDDCDLILDGFLPIMGFSDRIYLMQVPAPDMARALRDHMLINRPGER